LTSCKRRWIMTKYGFFGVLACLGGGVLIGFQAVSSVMGAKGGWQSITLMDIMGGKFFEWLANTSLGGAEKFAETIAAMPLYVLLFCIGVLLFALEYFLGRR